MGMNFGIEKCALLIMKKKLQMPGGIEPPNEEKIRTPEVKKTYKYLRISKEDTIKQGKMTDKNSISRERENDSEPNYRE